MRPPILYKDRLHEKRRKKLVFKFFLILMGLAALTGFAFYLAFFAGFLDLREIKISGNKTITDEKIKEVLEKSLSAKILFFIPARLNIFALNVGRMEKEITDNFSKLKEVNVIKKMPHEIIINISEKEPLGTWCYNKDNKDSPPSFGDCFYFDDNFTVFETAPYLTGSIYLHVNDRLHDTPNIGKMAAESDWAEKITQTDEWLKSNLDIEIREIIIPENSFDEFTVVTEDEWIIFIAKSLDIPHQLESLKIFINQKLSSQELKNLEYIDARVENRFYYKNK